MQQPDEHRDDERHAGRVEDRDVDMQRRGWVTQAERLRCTYLTREELPRAEAGRAKVTRLSATPA